MRVRLHLGEERLHWCWLRTRPRDRRSKSLIFGLRNLRARVRDVIFRGRFLTARAASRRGLYRRRGRLHRRRRRLAPRKRDEGILRRNFAVKRGEEKVHELVRREIRTT
eukprot:30694-Pelagococcus_subviridis.AAC.4